MSKQKKSYFMFLLDVIKNIQDKEYQERVWVRAEGPECDDFGDAMNDFFDFYDGIEDFETKYSEYGINTEQYQLLSKLYSQLRDYCDITPISPNDAKVLSDPRWQKIRSFAKVVYASLVKSR